jgi:hypothetical protein
MTLTNRQRFRYTEVKLGKKYPLPDGTEGTLRRFKKGDLAVGDWLLMPCGKDTAYYAFYRVTKIVPHPYQSHYALLNGGEAEEIPAFFVHTTIHGCADQDDWLLPESVDLEGVKTNDL